MASESVEEPDDVQFPWRSLHSASVAVNLIPRAWRVARSAWPLFLALLYGGRSDETGLVDLAVLFLFFGSAFGASVVHYLTLRYRVHGGRLEISSGLFNRQMRVIAPQRIQNVEMVKNLFQRAAGLVEVRIETASGTEVEGLLSALGVPQAKELIDALESVRRAAGSEPVGEEEEGELLARNGFGDLFRYGATATRFGAGALVVFGLAMEGMQMLDPQDVEEVGGFLSGSGLVLVGIVVLTGTWLLGTFTAVVRHHGFQLVQRGTHMVASEGLFTQRRVELPLGKIQLVTVREPLLRRLVGFGSVHIETAAAREQAGGTVSAEAMVPVVEARLLGELVHRAIPAAETDLWECKLRPPHPRALVRRLIGGGVRALILTAVVAWWFWPWGLVALAFLPIALVTAWLDHRHMGWLATDRVVVARQGYIDRRTAILSQEKVQSLEVTQGLIRRRWGLGVLTLRVAGSAVSLPDLGWEEALALQEELLRLRRIRVDADA
ncbi:MAG: PH domain-containing protein [Deltaproteobacteria bacterium]|nr:PH domain-containing protein [Deltaproteobacteria bacterium]